MHPNPNVLLIWIDKRCRVAINKFSLGEYYDNWVNEEQHGEGVMIYVNKDIYYGRWKNGKKDGQVTYILMSHVYC